jgi:multidrug efflux pump
MYLQAREGQSRAQLTEAQSKLLTQASHDPRLFNVRPNSLPQAPQLQLSVDRVQAQSMGLSLPDVYNTIQMDLAPVYVNQFTYGGRMKRVFLQADAPYRMGLEALQHMYTPSGVTGITSGSNGTVSAGVSADGMSSTGTSASGALGPVNPSVSGWSGANRYRIHL